MNFFEELKRRNVFRVGLAYLVASWLLLQITDILVPILDLPITASKFVFLLLAIGFIPALIFSWVYEMTSEGLKKEAEILSDPAIFGHTAKKLDKITIGLLVIVLAILALDRLVLEQPEKAPDTFPEEVISANNDNDEKNHSASLKGDGRQSIAVLPFVNMSNDQQNEYFSDGISEELLNVLVRVKSLRVPSRTSSFTFKGSDKKLSDIGRELQVDHVLEGSVRKSGDRIRVTAQLIDVRTDTHLWSEIYTRELDDIFAVQEEIAQAIVEALKVTLTGSDQNNLSTRSTSNVEAYNKYLLGRHYWNQRTPQSMRSAVEPLQAAVALDPEFDQAWAALADAYILLPEYFGGSIEENIPLARQAIERALSINPDSARALATSGYRKALYDYDWEGANEDFERAISLEPSYATAHQWYGEVLAIQGRTEDSLIQHKLAIEADPLSAIARMLLGHTYMYAHRFDEAWRHLLAANELRPSTPMIVGNLQVLAILSGEYERARAYINELASLLNFDPVFNLTFLNALVDPANKPEAMIFLADPQNYGLGVYSLPWFLAMLGEFDLALDALDTGFEAGDPYSSHLSKVYTFDTMRKNPRFQDMLERMNLLP